MKMLYLDPILLALLPLPLTPSPPAGRGQRLASCPLPLLTGEGLGMGVNEFANSVVCVMPPGYPPDPPPEQ